MKPPYNYITNSHVAHNIYAMKRQYGAPILLRRKGNVTADPKTGTPTYENHTWLIRRAAVLPEEVTRDAKQSISLITAQKQMVQGGGFDVGKRTFLIDARDLPKGHTVEKDDWIVFDDRHYDIDTINEYAYKSAWIIVGKELRGRTEGMDIIGLEVADTATLTDGDGEVVNL